MADKTKGSSSYGASDITVLEGLEPVRVRPGMYIGSTGPAGLHHLIWEVVDNSVDEAMAGFCTRIDVSLRADGSCRVVDDGRGIPVDEHPQYKGNRPRRSPSPFSTPVENSGETVTKYLVAYTASASPW